MAHTAGARAVGTTGSGNRRGIPSTGFAVAATSVAVLAVLAVTTRELDELEGHWRREDSGLMIREAALADLAAIDRAAGLPAAVNATGTGLRSPDAVRREIAARLDARVEALALSGRRALVHTAAVVLLACLLVTLVPWILHLRRRRRGGVSCAPALASGAGTAVVDPAGSPVAEPGTALAAGIGTMAEGVPPITVRAPARQLTPDTPAQGDAASAAFSPASVRAAGRQMQSLLARIGTAALRSAPADARPATGES